MTEKETELITNVMDAFGVLALNTNLETYNPRRHKRHLGEKENVTADFCYFNGVPQIKVWYGKTVYNFTLKLKDAPSKEAFVKLIMGRDGVDKLKTTYPQVVDLVGETALNARKKALVFKGI